MPLEKEEYMEYTFGKIHKGKKYMSRKIVVTSGKGGVGKTTVTANLGAALSEQGFRVCLVDADLGLNNLDIALGIENRVVYDLIDVIEGRCRARQALVKAAPFDNLYVLPSNHSYKGASISGQNLKVVTERLAESFDFVLVDCPAGIELGFHRAVSAVGEAIVVTTPDITAVRDASKTVSALSEYGVRIDGLVVNRARGDLMASGDMMNPDEIISLLKIPPLGVIPDDYAVGLFQSVGKVGGAGSKMCFEILADNLVRGERYVFDCERKYKGFFGKIRRSVKRSI